MAETPSKIHYPTNSDSFDPAGDMQQLARSIRHIVPVANATERDAVEQAFNPAPDRPLYVDRADTGTLERNAGNGWHLMALGEEQSYTPQLLASTQDPNIGTNGRATGMWARVGRMITTWVSFQAGGSGVSSGQGSIGVSLPISPLMDFYSVSANLGAGPPIGHGRIRTGGGSSTRNLYAQINANDGNVFFGIDERTSSLNSDDLTGNYALSATFNYYAEQA